jgi:LysR family nitrogen assimilation transcriptional regulator
MELRDLRALISIAETGSLSAAARLLNLTQPALSASLQRLEEELGVILVTRHSRGSSLTEEGKYVLQKSFDVIHDVAEIKSVVKDLSKEPIGTVRLGLPTTVAGGVISELLPVLQARYPQIRLHVVEAMSGVLSEQLQLGKLDLAVLYDVQPMAGLRSEAVLQEKLHLLVPADHAFAGRSRVRLEEVARLRLVLPSANHSIRRHIESYCSAEGLTLDVAADIDSLPGLFALVIAGYCTILPTFLTGTYARGGEIVAVEITRPAMEWTLHLASRHDARRPRASLATGKLLGEICRKLVRNGTWPGTVVDHARP